MLNTYSVFREKKNNRMQTVLPDQPVCVHQWKEAKVSEPPAVTRAGNQVLLSLADASSPEHGGRFLFVNFISSPKKQERKISYKGKFVYLFISTEFQCEGGEQRCQGFRYQSRDEQQQMLGGRAGVRQWQRAKRANKTRENRQDRKERARFRLRCHVQK